ncbi:S16 family serine protease [Gardnerella vaginalis]|jgi:secreted protein|uniref:endopeptidase La n=1 Tax=Gardnerella vaginalis (strain ATCC 14019 / 317) TaxID=525284 RepID=E3D934_GARV3|nr:S16 family serine protease [Gardnerella vaginalis]ADP38579.1 Lon protease (S16) C-terminal proteolytic domain protein [Gardnerella vaginalis ATCC 14019]KOS09046.1 Lon protease [Gardnerella vaginalis]NSX24655.1 Lon protease [Gardnerella vaginalis]PKZ53391.1 Lon protease [Gardnerella vaginalis]PKZ55500.1 Lon protease [Gardnerella vaginalis]
MTNKIFAVFNNGCMTVISFTSRVFNYFVKYFSSKSVQYFIGLIIGILAIIVLFLPSAYVVEEPGPTQDVLGKSSGKYVINVDNPNNPNNPNKKAASAVSGLKSHSKSGKLLLVTVNTSGVPGYEIPNIYAVLSWFDSKKQILPREVLVPVNQNASDYKKETNKQMTSSQSSAQVAALDYAKKHLNVNVKNVKVKMHIDDIGGPSAGMMYALGILNKLTGVDLAGGKTIAGTGTIDNNGKVGAIGGIRLKMISAKRDGARWFLAPNSNCDEVVGNIPQGLNVVSVKTLDDAYKALEKIKAGKSIKSFKTCNAKM